MKRTVEDVEESKAEVVVVVTKKVKKAVIEKMAGSAALLTDATKTVRSVILEQNRFDMRLLAKVVDGEITSKEFKQHASERFEGQWQFSMMSHNIRASEALCKHCCTYCYVGPMFKRWKRECKAPEYTQPMPVDAKKVAKVWKKVANVKDRKMVFFPSTMDIFEENARDYVGACRRIIDSGHEVFFVTKPTIRSATAVITAIEAAGDKYKKAMTVYVTITSTDDAVLKRFEPRAAGYAERAACVKLFKDHGFDINIMMEPYLSDPVPVLPELLAMLPETGTIAIGKMNYTSAMSLSTDPAEDASMKQYLDNLYTNEKALQLFETVRANPRLFLKKDSILHVLKAHGTK